MKNAALLWPSARSLRLPLACLLAPLLTCSARAQDTGDLRGAERGMPKAGAGIVLAPANKFDLDLFESNLKKAFDGKAIGYSYAINQGGQLKRTGEGGYAVLGRDFEKGGIIINPEGTEQSHLKRMNIASVSKALTSVTVLKIIQDKLTPGHPNLTINSKVAPFLPSGWMQGPGVANLTFKELMSQYSGMSIIPNGSASTPNLKLWIATGVTRAKSDYKYINGNLGIFRIIIPYMRASAKARKGLDLLEKVNPTNFSTMTAQMYVKEVSGLLVKMGINNASCKPEGDFLPTRFYNSPDNGVAGQLAGDWTVGAGGGGWYLSAMDLARFLAAVRYNDKILSPTTRKLMDANYLGWMDPGPWSLNGTYGKYLGHRGDLNWNKDDPKKRVGMTSLILNYPNGVQVAILVNSLGTYPSIHTGMRDAFDNSWK